MQTHVVYEGWYTFDGRFVTFNEVSHQHISNALWFNEVFNNRTSKNDKFMEQVEWILKKRFNGVRLPWAPLPIPNELNALHEMGLINPLGEILGNANTGLYDGKVIGSINHIERKAND